MEPTKYFNNVIIGQFVLTGVPVKVYIGGRYLTITDADDVENSIFGFGKTKEEIKSIIQNNTYQGNMAKLRLTTWRKINVK